MPDTLQQTPVPLRPPSLPVLLHGFGSNAQDMAAMARALCPAMLEAPALSTQGFETASRQPDARQWFGVNGMTAANRAQRVVLTGMRGPFGN